MIIDNLIFKNNMYLCKILILFFTTIHLIVGMNKKQSMQNLKRDLRMLQGDVKELKSRIQLIKDISKTKNKNGMYDKSLLEKLKMENKNCNQVNKNLNLKWIKLVLNMKIPLPIKNFIQRSIKKLKQKLKQSYRRIIAIIASSLKLFFSFMKTISFSGILLLIKKLQSSIINNPKLPKKKKKDDVDIFFEKFKFQNLCKKFKCEKFSDVLPKKENTKLLSSLPFFKTKTQKLFFMAWYISLLNTLNDPNFKFTDVENFECTKSVSLTIILGFIFVFLDLYEKFFS